MRDIVVAVGLGAAAGWGADRLAGRLVGASATTSTGAAASVACALAWAYAAWRWPGADRYAWMLFLWTLVVLADTDLRDRVLPDTLTLPLAVAGLLYRAAAGEGVASAAGLAAGGGLLALVALLGWATYRVEVFGWGDPKIGAALGAWLLWPDILYAVLGAFIIGGVVGAGMMLHKLANKTWQWRSAYLPFGPFLIAGAVLVMAS